MRKLFLFIALTAILLQGTAQNLETDRMPGELLVQLSAGNADVYLSELRDDFTDYRLMPVKQLSESMKIWLFQFDEENNSPQKILSLLRKHPAVSLAQFNHFVSERELIPNDPSFSAQWALKNLGQLSGTIGADIKATYAWDIATGGETVDGDTIVIAMIDGGIDLGHNDLRLWKNSHEIPFNSIDDDLNGYIDDYNGWNAYSNSGNMQQSDHGTHVAGIASAKGNNSLGITGVAFNSYLLPIAGSGSNEAVVVIAYDYVFKQRKLYNETDGQRGAFVVVTNSSFGIDGGNPANYPLWGAMYDSLGSVGILSVTSTANRGWDIDLNGDIPTSMTNESIVSVTNTTNKDVRNLQAGWGLTSIDLGAPGTNIYSTTSGSQYGYKSGTSMSSPQVSGAIALMYAAADPLTIDLYKNDPALVASKFKRYLIASVDTLPDMVGKSVSGGRLNLLNLLQMVQNPPMVIVSPPEISIPLAPDNQTIIPIELNGSGVSNNPYIIAIPDSATWLTASAYSGVLQAGIPEIIQVQIDGSGLEEGRYISSLTLTDNFLNTIIVPVEVKIQIGINTPRIQFENPGLVALPNPMQEASTLHFNLAKPSAIRLSAYDLSGRQVDVIFEGKLSAGKQAIHWNPNCQPGIYLVKLESDSGVWVLKVVKR